MKATRIIVCSAAALGLFLTLLVSGGYLWLRTSLPVTDGTLVLPGLHHTVTVERGKAGIPHIIAKDAHDAAFALGFVHAQDRLFQMDTLRRYGSGELAEWGGRSFVRRDRFMRTLGLAHAAKEQWKHLDASTKAQLKAYADGVNAYIDHHSGALFFAYDFLPGPRRWRPVDSLVIRNLMALYLSRNARQELLHARLIPKLPPGERKVLFPGYPDNAPVTLAGLAGAFRRLNLNRLAAQFPAGLPIREASNNWVVDGRHTASGKPILENDPHLDFTAPSFWYLARIDYPGYRLTGGTIPGAPFLIVGQNGHVGWGVTETGGDAEDFFVEKIDPDNPDRYLTPHGSAAFKTRREVIHVRGGADVTFTVRSTRHGPVLSDLVRSSPSPDSGHTAHRGMLGTAELGKGIRAALPGPQYVMALQATFLNGDDRTAQALWHIDQARNWRQFRRALRDFTAPELNFVFADTSGRIAFITPGRIPIRNSGRGWVPHPGWTGKYDWKGYIPFAKLPQGQDPASGHYLSANNRIVPHSYPYFIAAHWSPPYRAERIAGLLGATPIQTLDSTARIAGDDVSLMARQLLPLMLKTKPENGPSRKALRRLRTWNGTTTRDGVAPLLFEAWLRELNRALFAGKLGSAFAEYWHPNGLTIAAILRHPQHWCGAQGSHGKGACSQVLANSLARACNDVGDPTTWDKLAWGDRHKAWFTNFTTSSLPVIGPLLDPKIPDNGANETIDSGIMRFAADHPFRAIAGPSLRMILDFSDLSRSRFMMAPGVSENPLSPHYSDLLHRWRDVQWIDFSKSRALHTLTLTPHPDS